jgi:hypothetical protein
MDSLFNYQHSRHRHHQHHANPRNRRTNGRVRGRRMLVLVAAMLLFVGTATAVFYAHAHRTTDSERPSRLTFENGAGTPAQPADQFMHSIVTEDGALGWHQLCASLQRQLPMNALVQQAQAQRTTLAQYGVWLTVKFVGTQPQRDGGVSHVYIVTAHWPGGATQTRTYIVLTQPSGCVEDVQNHA